MPSVELGSYSARTKGRRTLPARYRHSSVPGFQSWSLSVLPLHQDQPKKDQAPRLFHAPTILVNWAWNFNFSWKLKCCNWAWHFNCSCKLKCQEIKTFLDLKFSDIVSIMLINVKMPTIVGILTFMSMIYFMLSWVELNAYLTRLMFLYYTTPLFINYFEPIHLQDFRYCLFVLLLYVPLNSYGHYGTVSYLTTLFPEQAVNQYFLHILSLVTDNNPSWMIHSVKGRRMIVEIISHSSPFRWMNHSRRFQFSSPIDKQSW